MTRHRGPESKDWPKEKQHRKEARNSKKNTGLLPKMRPKEVHGFGHLTRRSLNVSTLLLKERFGRCNQYITAFSSDT
jgi:hypothetical protein